MRRKQLRRVLRSVWSLTVEEADAILSSCDIDPSARPETLSPEQFARIVRDEAAGMSLDDAFEETVRRMRNSDLRQIAIVSLIQPPIE